jgi:hypothetical protein
VAIADGDFQINVELRAGADRGRHRAPRRRRPVRTGAIVSSAQRAPLAG